jgi:GNAT superfamily N-acetyltransferase
MATDPRSCGTHGPLHLIRLQLAIECIGLDQDGLLLRIPGPDPDEIARVYAYRHECGYVTYFRRDLPAVLREQVHDLGADTAFHDRKAVKTLLAADAPCAEVGVFHTYVFPDTPNPNQFPDAVRLGELHQELIEAYHAGMNVAERAVFAVIRDGLIVSTCGSVRENEGAGECSLFTLPEYRRRGYGRQATAAWGNHLGKRGKVAFYSHTEENTASRAVAQSLGLQPSFRLTVYS